MVQKKGTLIATSLLEDLEYVLRITRNCKLGLVYQGGRGSLRFGFGSFGQFGSPTVRFKHSVRFVRSKDGPAAGTRRRSRAADAGGSPPSGPAWRGFYGSFSPVVFFGEFSTSYWTYCSFSRGLNQTEGPHIKQPHE